jgi:hypothetical protein
MFKKNKQQNDINQQEISTIIGEDFALRPQLFMIQ